MGGAKPEARSLGPSDSAATGGALDIADGAARSRT
jgi:hypothetical protein